MFCDICDNELMPVAERLAIHLREVRVRVRIREKSLTYEIYIWVHLFVGFRVRVHKNIAHI